MAEDPKQEFDAQREIDAALLRRSIHETVAMSTVAKSLNIAAKQVEQLVSEYGKAQDRGWLAKGAENSPIAKLFDAAKQRMADMRAGRIAVDLPSGRRLPDLSTDASTPKGRSQGIKTITQGIWGALGGKRMRYLTRALNLGPAGAAVMAGQALVQNTIERAKIAQGTSLSALATGMMSPAEMRALENAIMKRGGSREDAHKLAMQIAHFKYGTEMGLGMGPLQEWFKAAGIDIAPHYSWQRILEGLSKGASKETKGRAAALATQSGIPSAVLKWLLEGPESIAEGLAIDEAEAKRLEDLEKTQKSLNELEVASNKLKDQFSILMNTPIDLFTEGIKLATDALSKWHDMLSERSDFWSDFLRVVSGEEDPEGHYNIWRDFFKNINNAIEKPDSPEASSGAKIISDALTIGPTTFGGLGFGMFGYNPYTYGANIYRANHGLINDRNPFDDEFGNKRLYTPLNTDVLSFAGNKYSTNPLSASLPSTFTELPSQHLDIDLNLNSEGDLAEKIKEIGQQVLLDAFSEALKDNSSNFSNRLPVIMQNP